MPRHKRINLPGAIYHVIVRGLEKRALFNDDRDRFEFLSRLSKSLKRSFCECYAWVLMSNHIHLLLRTGISSLSAVMRSLLTSYAVYFNHAYKRNGYLYQNRYKSILCQEDSYFLKLVAYIHLNPIRARIVNSIDELDHYPWCGHSTIVGSVKHDWQNINEVLLHFSRNKRTARTLYRKFINKQSGKERNINMINGNYKQSATGWKHIDSSVSDNTSWRGDGRILGDKGFVDSILKKANEGLDKKCRLRAAGWNIDTLTSYICELYNVSEKDILKKGRSNALSSAKGLICYWGYNKLGLSGAELSRYLDVSRPAISKNINLGKIISEKQSLKLIS